MIKRTGLGVILALSSVTLFAGNKTKPDTGPSAQELIHLYKKAVTCWDRSVAMRIELVHSYDRRSTDDMDIRRWTFDMTHRRDGDRCEWFGSCQFRGGHDGGETSINEVFKRIVGDDFVQYYSESDFEEETGDAFMAGDVQETLFRLQAQGQKGGFLEGRMGGIGLAPKIVDVMAASDSLYLLGQERLGNSLCYIVEAKTKYGTMTVWLAPDKGYNALKYRVRKLGPDILRDDIRIEDQGITEWVEVVHSIDVRKIDGVFVPVSGELKGHAKAGNAWQSKSQIKVRRSQIALHPDFEALGAFQIDFPEGTEVTHQDIPGRRFRWTQGRFVPDMDDYLLKTLQGGPLPSFDGIHFGSPPQRSGQRLLICFFDLQQRPSRNWLRRLTEQTQALQKKGVTVIAVQAEKLDEDRLQAWLRENRILFPVGVITDDTEKTSNAWGVKSLPWLILTDKAHIVHAEGIGLGDLKALVETYENSKGAVEVQVTAAGATDVLAGAVVRIRHLDSDQRFETQSDDTGIARFSLAPGAYQLVSVGKKGYLTEEMTKDITVTETQTGRMQIQLTACPKLTGTVRNRAGGVVPGTMLYLLPDSRNANAPIIFDVSGCEATTDAQGVYELQRQLGLFTTMKGKILNVYARHIDRNLVAMTELENENERLDLTLTQGTVITGVVIDHDGNPIPDAKVSFRFRSWLYGYHFSDQVVATNAQGRYEIRGLWPDRRYIVVARAEGYGEQSVAAHCSRDASNHCTEFEPLVLKPADLAVSGRVVDIHGTPVSDARVSCSGAGQPRRTTQTDANGRFTLEGVCAGPLDVRARKSGTTIRYGSITSTGGAVDVSLVVEERPTKKSTPPATLIGKPLPEFAALKIDLAPAALEGRALLVCFWDMNQRPSRNCIIQLAERAQELQREGVVVVTIQAAESDDNELDEWMKKHNIPFPMGMIVRDTQKTRHTWGVRSLPWLILTNRNRVVVAEGFPLVELENRLDQVGGGP